MITNSFDNSTKAIPSLKHFYGEQKHLIDKCLIIFSKKIFNYLLSHFRIQVLGSINACNGQTNVYGFTYEGVTIGFYLSPIGSTLSSQYCIECNWITGARKFIMFGSAGSLNKKITTGKYVVPTEAYRDEGMSYHYAEPQDYILVKNHDIIKSFFDKNEIPFIEGKIWTTDAFLRETELLTNQRIKEGCIAVEMEVAGVQAVCDYHGFELFNFLVTGDVLSDIEYHCEGLSKANHDLQNLHLALEIAKRV